MAKGGEGLNDDYLLSTDLPAPSTETYQERVARARASNGSITDFPPPAAAESGPTIVSDMPDLPLTRSRAPLSDEERRYLQSIESSGFLSAICICLAGQRQQLEETSTQPPDQAQLKRLRSRYSAETASNDVSHAKSVGNLFSSVGEAHASGSLNGVNGKVW
mmetsp:Transcript_49643/g.130576  ORF Transcript_49643/g.130576 Transcript_49643/m.130576 type:complete len:162 (-) Transcript_49643:150-635(-)